jgi:hypothetical protein
MAERDLQAELELYKEAFFTKDNNKLIQFYKSLFQREIHLSGHLYSSDTLYISACRVGNYHAISLLYELGDQTYNEKTDVGVTPVEMATVYCNKECVRTLLEIPEYQQIGKNIFIDYVQYCDNDAIIEMIVEAAFRIHTTDYFEYPRYFKYSNGHIPKLFRILHAVCGDQQDHVDEDDVLRIRYWVFFNRSLTSRLLLKN